MRIIQKSPGDIVFVLEIRKDMSIAVFPYFLVILKEISPIYFRASVDKNLNIGIHPADQIGAGIKIIKEIAFDLLPQQENPPPYKDRRAWKRQKIHFYGYRYQNQNNRCSTFATPKFNIQNMSPNLQTIPVRCLNLGEEKRKGTRFSQEREMTLTMKTIYAAAAK